MRSSYNVNMFLLPKQRKHVHTGHRVDQIMPRRTQPLQIPLIQGFQEKQTAYHALRHWCPVRHRTIRPISVCAPATPAPPAIEIANVSPLNKPPATLSGLSAGSSPFTSLSIVVMKVATVARASVRPDSLASCRLSTFCRALHPRSSFR